MPVVAQKFRPLKQAIQAPQAIQTETVQSQPQSQSRSQQQALNSTSLTAASSLAAIKATVEIALGSIAYLRSFLPEDHFDSKELTSLKHPFTEDGVSSAPDEVASIKVMKIKSGSSAEGDAFLKYFNEGVVDALERSYLKSMVLLVLLDPVNDPNNIIESYTFDFTYSTDTEGPSIAFNSSQKSVSSTSSFFLPQTVPELRLAIRSFMYKLILGLQELDPLPRHRYVDIKLVYRDDTPLDYEPPQFHPNPETERLFIASHNRDEVPRAVEGGTLDTPDMGFSVTVLSAASFLPVNNAGGVVDLNTQQAMYNAQLEDSKARRVHWDAQTLALHADQPMERKGRTAHKAAQVVNQMSDSLEMAQDTDRPAECATNENDVAANFLPVAAPPHAAENQALGSSGPSSPMKRSSNKKTAKKTNTKPRTLKPQIIKAQPSHTPQMVKTKTVKLKPTKSPGQSRAQRSRSQSVLPPGMIHVDDPLVRKFIRQKIPASPKIARAAPTNMAEAATRADRATPSMPPPPTPIATPSAPPRQPPTPRQVSHPATQPSHRSVPLSPSRSQPVTQLRASRAAFPINFPFV